MGRSDVADQRAGRPRPAPCQGLYHRAAGTRPRIACIATHYNVDFSEHYIGEPLAERGIGFLGWNTRYRGNEAFFTLEQAVTLDAESRRWLDEEGAFTARKNVQLLEEFAARPARDDAARRIELRFLGSPVEIRGDGRVEEIDVARNAIARDDSGTLRARPTGDPVETIECGLVLRSVGYRAVPLPDVPFDERAFILPSEQGRVLTPEGERLPGVYAVGWIKRGPTGILGTNKRDAEETVGCLVEDLRDLPSPPAGREELDALLRSRKPDLVTADGWHAIERARAAARRGVLAAARQARLARRAARGGGRYGEPLASSSRSCCRGRRCRGSSRRSRGRRRSARRA